MTWASKPFHRGSEAPAHFVPVKTNLLVPARLSSFLVCLALSIVERVAYEELNIAPQLGRTLPLSKLTCALLQNRYETPRSDRLKGGISFWRDPLLLSQYCQLKRKRYISQGTWRLCKKPEQHEINQPIEAQTPERQIPKQASAEGRCIKQHLEELDAQGYKWDRLKRLRKNFVPNTHTQ